MVNTLSTGLSSGSRPLSTSLSTGRWLGRHSPSTNLGRRRNFVHVVDIARTYVRSAERLLEQLKRGTTGTETYEIASEEDMSVMTIAEIVQKIIREERNINVNINLVDNPRAGETMVKEFMVDTSVARDRLGWEPKEQVEETVRKEVAEHTSNIDVCCLFYQAYCELIYAYVQYPITNIFSAAIARQTLPVNQYIPACHGLPYSRKQILSLQAALT